jgi:regulator of sirC expression with transglutaminase-like and TPR domain
LKRLLATDAPDPVALAFAVARMQDPGLDGGAVEKRLADAAAGLRTSLANATEDEARVGALSHAVHQVLGLKVEQEVALELATVNVFPHQVFERRRGACLGLSLIYLSLAQRAGLDVRGVSLPGHFFVRYRGTVTLNLEPTLEGLVRPDRWYRERTGLPEKGAVGNYLRDLSAREVVAEVLNNVAGERVREGKAGRAVPLLRIACRLSPDDPDAHYNLAHALREIGKVAAATAAVGRSLTLYRSKGASNLRGLIRLGRDRPDLAEADFSVAIRLDPKEARYRNNRGSARCFMGRFGEGIEDFGEALRLRPGWDQALRNRALAYLEVGKAKEAGADLRGAGPGHGSWGELLGSLPETADVGRALRDMAGGLAGAPSLAMAALFAAGDRFMAVKRPQEAKAIYDRVLRLGGRDVEAYCKRGLACERLGDELWAKRNYYLATQADRRDPLGYKYMAQFYVRRDRYAVAADYFRKYLDRAPKDVSDRDEVEALLKEIESALGR